MLRFEFKPSTPGEAAAFAKEIELEKVLRWHKFIGPEKGRPANYKGPLSRAEELFKECNDLWAKAYK